jgi:hypothetical protein
MAAVKALVLTGYGLNCDYETAHALDLAGASTERVHINTLIEGGKRLSDYRILAFGGGFSWADDHGAGVIQAVRLKTNIGDQLLNFIEGGNLVIGKHDFAETEAKFLAMGFDRVFPADCDLDEAVACLRQDLGEHADVN